MTHFNRETRNMNGALDTVSSLLKERNQLRVKLDKIAALTLERQVIFSSDILDILTAPEKEYAASS